MAAAGTHSRDSRLSLKRACKENDVHLLRHLVRWEIGSLDDVIFSNSMSPLQVAIQGHPSVPFVQCLLDNGCQPGRVNSHGRTCLQELAHQFLRGSRGKEQIAEELVKAWPAGLTNGGRTGVSPTVMLETGAIASGLESADFEDHQGHCRRLLRRLIRIVHAAERSLARARPRTIRDTGAVATRVSPGPAPGSPRRRTRRSTVTASPRRSSGSITAVPTTPRRSTVTASPRRSSGSITAVPTTPRRSTVTASPRRSSGSIAAVPTTPRRSTVTASPRRSSGSIAAVPTTPRRSTVTASPRRSSVSIAAVPTTPRRATGSAEPVATTALEAAMLTAPKPATESCRVDACKELTIVSDHMGRLIQDQEQHFASSTCRSSDDEPVATDVELDTAAAADKPAAVLDEDATHITLRLPIRAARALLAAFECPITRMPMTEPVIASDGHTYDSSAISRWIECGEGKSPMVGTRLVDSKLRPNLAIRSLAQALAECV